MTPKEIIEAAREAGLTENEIGIKISHDMSAIQRFAAIIAARQREKDAGICEKLTQVPYGDGTHIALFTHHGNKECAKAIREQE